MSKKAILFISLFFYFLSFSNINAEENQIKTLKKFLQIALQPVGGTMYVWGGGWH